MKITICDPCKKQDNVITETMKYLRVKRRPDLRLDVCDTHNREVTKLSMPDYVRFVYGLDGLDLSDKSDLEIQKQFLRA